MSAACQEIFPDIEDLIDAQELTPKERYSNKKNVTARVKKRNTQLTSEVYESEVPRSVIPGTQKIYVKTWGCTHNSSDSEYMAGQLAAYGYTLTSRWCFCCYV